MDAAVRELRELFGTEMEIEFLSASGSEALEAPVVFAAAPADAPKPTIGSLKANIGHPITASGVASLLKVLSAFDAELLPPTPCDDPLDLVGGEVGEVDRSTRVVHRHAVDGRVDVDTHQVGAAPEAGHLRARFRRRRLSARGASTTIGRRR